MLNKEIMNYESPYNADHAQKGYSELFNS